MTREEILLGLKNIAAAEGLYDDRKPSRRALILGEAIEALEQESCIYYDKDGYCRYASIFTVKIDEKVAQDIKKLQELNNQPLITSVLPAEPKVEASGTDYVLDKIRAEIKDTLYVDSLIFGELIDFKNGKISADDVIEEFNRVTRMEILHILDKYKSESEG